jgi:hypothetical protein
MRFLTACPRSNVPASATCIKFEQAINLPPTYDFLFASGLQRRGNLSRIFTQIEEEMDSNGSDVGNTK